MEASYLTRHPRIRDLINFGILVIAVLIGTLLLNTYVFRSFSVSGHSMDNTLSDGDRLIINRIPVTIAQIHNKNYLPNRGQIIVFTNPVYTPGSADRYIVKRVIAFPGERVVVKDGVLTVYNNDHPDGFQPDKTTRKNNVGPVTGQYQMARSSYLATIVLAITRSTRVVVSALFRLTT